MKRGIVIGKFYPPHKGHGYLIETAKKKVDELTILICDRKDQAIPATLRKKWLEEIYPDVKVCLIEDILKDDDSAAWAEHTKKFLGYIPDVVFTSETYGDPYATLLGSSHTLVDLERKVVPISATKIRQHPFVYWEYLEPCVQAHFARRICIVGAESSGTTTMAKALAEHFKTVWVPEFGRLYSEAKLSSGSLEWSENEFIFIANEQNRIEDQLAKACNKILICDTDSFATSIWHERYRGYQSPLVEKMSEGRHYDLYFLTNVDIPFVQDGTRDGEHVRHQMHKRFEEDLNKRNKKYVLLSGTHEERLAKAITECEAFFNI